MDGNWIRMLRRNSRALALIPFVLCAWLTWLNGPALGQSLSTVRWSEETPDVAGGVPPPGEIEDILSLADEPLEMLAARPVVSLEIDPVIEAVSMREERVSESPGIVDVITAKDIKEFGAKNLYEVLRWATSVYMTGSYLYPRNVTSLRGDLSTHSDNHVLVLINGRPFRDITQGGINTPIYTAFPIHMIERVEVIRGPGSVLYGTNGYAGVVNVVTKNPDGPMLHAAVLGGSHGLQQYSLSGGTGSEASAVYGGATHTRQKGWPFSAISEDPPGPRGPESGTTLYGEDNVGFFGMYRNGGLSANVFLADASQEHFGPSPVWPSAALEADRVFLDLGYRFGSCEHHYLDVHFTYNYEEAVFSQDPPPPGFVPPLSTVTPSHSLLLEATYHTRLTQRMDMLVGGIADIHRGKVSAGDNALVFVPEFDEVWYGVYLQLDYHPTEWLTLVGGMQGHLPGEIAGGLVPRAAAIVSITDNWTGKFLYGQAFRSPYQIERSIVVPPILLGNPNLSPETVQTFDAQIAYHTDTYRLAATYFHSDYFNLITRVGAFPATYENTGTMQFQGVELENEWRISDRLRWQGSVTYQDNVRDGVHDTTHTPNWMAKMGVAYSTDNGWTVGVFDTFYGAPSSVTVVNPAASIVNSVPEEHHLISLNATVDLDRFLHWHAGHSVNLQFLVQNLLNESIYHPEFSRRNINSLPGGPGRTFYGGVSLEY